MITLIGYLHSKSIFMIICTVTVVCLFLPTGSKSTVNETNALASSCDTGVILPSSPSSALASILVHGYAEDSGVWSKWEPLLKHDGIPYCTASFQNDECGAAVDHADELGNIVQKVKLLTHKDQVNIVGHSKGGLDARVYLAQRTSSDVDNLIMIGTPNGGGPLADFTISSNAFNPWFYSPFSHSFFCTPALFDLRTGAEDTRVRENDNTDYYTIYGDWKPSLPCRFLGSEDMGYEFLRSIGDVPNDGIVPKWSVEVLPNFTNLGHTNHCHTDLLSSQEYDISKSLLLSGR